MPITTVLAVLPLAVSSPRIEVADAESATGERSSHLLAFDSEGDVSAEIIVWRDADDQPRLDVVFADGLYLTAVDGVIETEDAAEVAARLDAIDDWLAAEPGMQGRSWLECGGKTLVAGWACAGPWVPACVGATVLAVCECLPLLSSGEAEC